MRSIFQNKINQVIGEMNQMENEMDDLIDFFDNEHVILQKTINKKLCKLNTNKENKTNEIFRLDQYHTEGKKLEENKSDNFIQYLTCDENLSKIENSDDFLVTKKDSEILKIANINISSKFNYNFDELSH